MNYFDFSSEDESNNKSKNNLNLFHKYKDFSLINSYKSPYKDDDVRSLKSTSSFKKHFF